MANRELKTTLRVEGDAEYQRAIKSINTELTTLRSEMQVVDAKFAGNEKSVEALTEKTGVLSRQYDTQKQKLDTLSAALKNAQSEQEKSNAKVEECRLKYERAQQELKEYNASISGITKEQKRLEEAVQDAEEKLERYKQSTNKTAEEQKQLEDALNQARQALEKHRESTKEATDQQKKLKDNVEEAKKELQVAEKYQQKCANTIVDYGKKTNYTQAEVYKLEKQLEDTNNDLANAKNEAEKAAQSVEDLGDEMQDGAQKSKDFGEKSSDGVNALAAAIAASGVKEGLQEIVRAIESCMDASMQFESAITGVYKTVEGTPEQLQTIRDGILEMSTRIPAATRQIAGVAEAAGQLGIATEDVLDFTRVMIDLGESTNLSADEAASSLAKFANITGTASSDYSRLGSVVVGLGNNFATTEADIVGMATRLASAGELAGLTEPQIMALAASMSSVGIEAEAGGTAMTQTLTEIEKAVANGGDQLELFASIAGMSAREFANLWNTNAVSAIQAFVSGLGTLDEQGESAVLVLDELGLSGVRQSNMLKSLALASDEMGRAIDLANTAWEENTALTEEAGKRYETVESKVAMAQNAFDNLKIAVGDQLKPVLEGAAEAGTSAFSWAADFVSENPAVVGALTAVTTALGLLAAGVAGVSLATQVVIPLISAFSATLTASPIGPVVLAIGAAVSVLSGLAVAFSDTEAPQADYTRRLEDAKAATDALESATEDLNQTISDNAYNTNQVRVYVSELKRLEAQGLENEAVQAVYNKTVGKIRELLPDLTVEIDEMTGAVEGGTDAILLYAGAMEEQADAVAALEAYQDAQNAVESTTLALQENEAELQMYQDELAALQAELDSCTDVQERDNFLWSDKGDRMAELGNTVIPGCRESIERLNEELGLQEEALEALDEMQGQYHRTVETGNGVIGEASAAYSAFSSEMDGITAELQQLETEYKDAYDAAYANISGQFGLFETMDQVVGSSVDSMIASLQSQSDYMDEYAANLKRAAELGVDEGLIAELSDGSVESAKYLKAIVDDGGENIDKLNDEFKRVEQGKQSFSDQVAKLSTDFHSRMSEIDARLEQTVEAFNQKTQAISNTNETINGIVETANARVGSVRAAYVNLARQANAAYRSTLDIHSPSKVFAYNTEMTVDAITNTAKSSEPEVAESYKNLAGVASGAYYDATQKTQALYGQTVRTYNRLTSGAMDVGSSAQLTRIADKLDDLKQVTEDSRVDEDALASKLGDAVSRVQVKAEAVISKRRAAEELTPEVDKRQGNALSLRERGVI